MGGARALGAGPPPFPWGSKSCSLTSSQPQDLRWLGCPLTTESWTVTTGPRPQLGRLHFHFLLLPRWFRAMGSETPVSRDCLGSLSEAGRLTVAFSYLIPMSCLIDSHYISESLSDADKHCPLPSSVSCRSDLLLISHLCLCLCTWSQARRPLFV